MGGIFIGDEPHTGRLAEDHHLVRRRKAAQAGAAQAAFELAHAVAGKLDESLRLYLDLGEVREVAQVRVNGQDLGILWKKPFRVALGTAARAGRNQLEVAVMNLWPNRLIGDQRLPPERRLAWNNIAKFRADSPLLPSGLLGPAKVEIDRVVRMVRGN